MSTMTLIVAPTLIATREKNRYQIKKSWTSWIDGNIKGRHTRWRRVHAERESIAARWPCHRQSSRYRSGEGSCRQWGRDGHLETNRLTFASLIFTPTRNIRIFDTRNFLIRLHDLPVILSFFVLAHPMIDGRHLIILFSPIILFISYFWKDSAKIIGKEIIIIKSHFFTESG